MTLHLDYGEDAPFREHWACHGHVMGMSWAMAHPHIPASSQFHLFVAQGSKSKGHEGAADTGHFPRLTLALTSMLQRQERKVTSRNGKERKVESDVSDVSHVLHLQCTSSRPPQEEIIHTKA